METYRFLLVVLCVTGIPFLAYQAWPRPEEPTGFAIDGQYRTHRERQAEVMREFGGAKGLYTVLKAERVEAFRIQPPASDPSASGPACSIIAGPIAVPHAIRRELSAMLTREESYGWGYSVGCLPTYGVRLSFFCGRDRVDADLCLTCTVMRFYRNGERTGGALMGPSADKLTQFAKELFPDDEAIQKLN